MVLDGPEAARLAQVALAVPVGHVVVEVEQTGICGTDASIYRGLVPVSYPRIMGHEVVGRVVLHGSNSDGAPPLGSRVLVDPSNACGLCPVCRGGRSNLCPAGGLLGRDSDGALAGAVVAAAVRLHLVPEDMAADDAALLQVLGTCVHAHRQFPVFPGQAAVVVGLGVSGLLHVQLLRARGIGTVVGIGRSKDKRTLATSLGATAVAEPSEAAAVVDEVTGGAGASVVIEAVGSDATVAAAVALAGPGATVVLFGTVPGPGGTMPFYDLYHKECTVLCPRAALPVDYDDAIALVGSGAVRGRDLVSDRLPLAAVPEVLASWPGDSRRLKVVFEP